jgi:mannose-6-phosphate isomerase-like protein (cupin superfamily)
METVMLADLKNQTALGDWLVAEWTADPTEERMFQAPIHRHFTCDEAWYVLEGTLGFLVEDVEFFAKAGELMLVERGKSHTFWCEGSQPARYLIFVTPKVDQLISRIHSASDRSWPALQALFAEHDSELLG